MSLLEIVADVRLIILSELLVLQEPIEFCTDIRASSPPLLRYPRRGLHPAILRVCKSVFEEAIPLLYSQNRFQFPGRLGDPDRAHIAPFLGQIGPLAKLLRNIRIPFPFYTDLVLGCATLSEKHFEIFHRIGTTTNIKTLELFVDPEELHESLGDSLTGLNALNKHLEAMHTLETVNIIFKVYSECDVSNELKTGMRGMGWIVKFEMLPKELDFLRSSRRVWQ